MNSSAFLWFLRRIPGFACGAGIIAAVSAFLPAGGPADMPGFSASDSARGAVQMSPPPAIRPGSPEQRVTLAAVMSPHAGALPGSFSRQDFFSFQPVPALYFPASDGRAGYLTRSVSLDRGQLALRRFRSLRIPEPPAADESAAEAPVPSGPEIFLTVDRGVYRRGDTIHVFGLMRNGGAALGKAEVRLTGPEQDFLTAAAAAPDSAGRLTFRLPVKEDYPDGLYTLEARLSGSMLPIGKTFFLVETGGKPESILAMESDDKAGGGRDGLPSKPGPDGSHEFLIRVSASPPPVSEPFNNIL